MPDDDVCTPPEAPREVSRGYRMSMAAIPRTLYFEDLFSDEPDPQHFFVTARPSGTKEDEVTAASLTVSYEQIAGTRKLRPIVGAPRPAAAFVAKCAVQITDFCLPGVEADGGLCDWTFDPPKKGVSVFNQRVYECLLNVGELHQRIEAFLDDLAGREEMAEQDWTDLGNLHMGLDAAS
jgi:hypothetical protein